MTSYDFQNFNAGSTFLPDKADVVLGHLWYAVRLEQTSLGFYQYLYRALPEAVDQDVSKVLSTESISRVRVALASLKYALVPTEAMNSPESAEEIAHAHYFLTQGDDVAVDTVYRHGIHNLFVTSLADDIGLRKGMIKVHHYLSPLISFLPVEYNRIYLFHSHHNTSIVGMKDGRAAYAQLLETRSEEEVLYHAIQAYRSIGLSPLSDPLYLAGRFVEESSLYRLLYRFVKDIRWLSMPGYEGQEGHLFYDLYLLSKYL